MRILYETVAAGAVTGNKNVSAPDKCPLGALADVAEVDIALAGVNSISPAVNHGIHLRGEPVVKAPALPADILGYCRPCYAQPAGSFALGEAPVIDEAGYHLGPHPRQYCPDKGIAMDEEAGIVIHTQA